MLTLFRNLRTPVEGRPHRSFALTSLLVSFALGAAATLAPSAGEATASEKLADARCNLPQGVLSPSDLPSGSSVVECQAVGRMVRSEGVELTIPEPGMGVSFEGVSALGTDPQHFQLEVSTDGVIRYPEPRAPEGGVESNNPAPAADPDACDDGANAWLDWSAYPTYKWYIGDGGMPGALSRSAAQKAFADAINNITASYNDCGLSDEVSVGHDYAGTTTYESDMTATGCAERDKVGTWDAGDLAVGTLAATCAWYFTGGGSFGQLEEADVRYNTKDYDFTNDPVAGPCTNKYDIRSVGTHEAGHVYGMAHVGNGHSNLTMYTNSFLCNTKARTLGKGDVLGLRKHY